MAHELDRNTKTGAEAMMYVGKEPWHGLGTKLNNPATAEEAIVSAGLDWEVATSPISITGPDGERIEVMVTDKQAVVRLDRTGPECILGYVSQKYQPIANRECFRFFDGIVGEGKAIYHTAGSLRGGKWVWLLAKLPDDIHVGDDVVEQFLLLTNNHEGKEALMCRFTPIRVVCMNTLSAALKGTGNIARVLHMGDLDWQFAQASKMLGFAQTYFKNTEDVYKQMADVQFTSNQAKDYFQRVIPDNPEAKWNTRTENVRKQMLDLFEGAGAGAQLNGVRGTLWGAWNSVAEYIDHDRQSGSKPEKRLISSWFGSGSDIRDKSFDKALALIN